MSEAFQRSSSPSDEGLSIDAESSLLWRYPPRRVEAEVIRDSILQASGNLNSDLGGAAAGSTILRNIPNGRCSIILDQRHGEE